MKNWLEIVVGVYLLGMILYGHYRGFIRMAVSMVALIATFAIVRIAMPYVNEAAIERTPLYEWIKGGIEHALIPEEYSSEAADEQAMIEGLGLPKEIQELLIENNRPDVYQALGVQVFTEYLGNYLAGLLVNTVGFVLLFVLVYIAVRLIMRWLDIMARLPIISGVNKLTGALLGGAEGLFFLWLLSLLVTAFSQSPWGAMIIAQIESSRWLTFLYHYNFVSKVVLGIIRGVL